MKIQFRKIIFFHSIFPSKSGVALFYKTCDADPCKIRSSSGSLPLENISFTVGVVGYRYLVNLLRGGGLSVHILPGLRVVFRILLKNK